MTPRHELVLALVVAFATTGCGAAPPPAPKKVAIPTKPTASVAELEPPPDTSPVPEPSSLIAVGRVSPAAAPVFAVLDEPFSGLSEDPVRKMAFWLPSSLADARDPNAPLDFAVSIDSPETLFGRGPDLAMSVGLSSLDDSVAALRRAEQDGSLVLTRHGAGVFAVRRAGADDECWVMAAAGPAPARLVCGTSPAALETLAAYLARTFASKKLGDDAAAVFQSWPARFVEPNRDALARSVKFFVPMAARSDSELSRMQEAITTVLDDGIELAGDTSEVRAVLERDTLGFVLDVEAKVPGTRSWLSRAFASYAKRAGPANALYARLPRDAGFAFFSANAAPERTGEARSLLVSSLAQYFGPNVQRSTLELVSETFLQQAPYAYAQGDALGHDTRGPYGGRHLWEKTLSTFGWHVLALEEPLSELVGELDKGMNAYNGGDLHDLAYRELAQLCAGLGKITKRRAVFKGLPPKSLLYELKLPGKFFDDCVTKSGWPVREHAPAESLAVVVVPDGARTFIVFGPNPVQMEKRMVALLSPPTGSTLGEAALPERPAADAVMGGYVSLAGLGDLQRFLSMQEPFAWRRERTAWLPRQGMTHVPFQVRITSGSPLKVETRLFLASTTLDDLTAWSRGHAASH